MEKDFDKSEKILNETSALLQWLRGIEIKNSRKTREINRKIEELKVDVTELIADVLRKTPELAEQLILGGNENNQIAASSVRRGRKPVEGSRKSELSAFLLELRDRLGLSQNALQEKIHFEKPQYISKIESGSILVPNDDFLEKLSKISGKTVEALRKMATTR